MIYNITGSSSIDQFWSMMVELVDNPLVFRINGDLYVVDNDMDDHYGYSIMETSTIRMISGIDKGSIYGFVLRYIGRIPNGFRDLLPNNAEFC
jgi:hypothetical protein